MPITSYEFSPATESTISLQDMPVLMGHRFTAVSSGKRAPYSVTATLVRGGGTLTAWPYASFDQDYKKVDAPFWDTSGGAGHELHNDATGAITFSSALNEASMERYRNVSANSRIILSFSTDETLAGGDAEFQVNLYDQDDVLIGSSVFTVSPGDGVDAYKFMFELSDEVTRPKLVFENLTWTAASGSVFVEAITIEDYVADTLLTGLFKVFLYAIEDNEVIATTQSPIDISTLELGENLIEFLFDDPRFPIVAGKEYYLLFTLNNQDYTGWDVIPTGAEKVLPTGALQSNEWLSMSEHTGLTTETDTDFPGEVYNSPLRTTKSVVSLSGVDTAVYGLSGYIGLKPSQLYRMRLRVIATSLANYLGGGGANVIDLTAQIITHKGTVLDDLVYQVALEDVGTYYDFILEFTTPVDECEFQLEVLWDASAINPTYTPDITYKVTGVYLWEYDGVASNPSKYQLPSTSPGYAGIFLVTEDGTTETVEKRSGGAWLADPTLGGVVMSVQANSLTTSQGNLTPTGDLLDALNTIWPSDKVAQPAAMSQVLGIIQEALNTINSTLSRTIQLRQDDVPYQSDWITGLINNYGVSELDPYATYIWTTSDNAYGGRFFVKDGEVIPFSTPQGLGRVELTDLTVGSGQIGSGTSTKYALATIDFSLQRPAKVKLIWAVSIEDSIIVANERLSILLELDGVSVPTGAGADDVTDKMFIKGTATSPSNSYFLEFSFDDVLDAGDHSIVIKGMRGATITTPATNVYERLYTLPVYLNNFYLKPTSMLEVVYQ